MSQYEKAEIQNIESFLLLFLFPNNTSIFANI